MLDLLVCLIVCMHFYTITLYTYAFEIYCCDSWMVFGLVVRGLAVRFPHEMVGYVMGAMNLDACGGDVRRSGGLKPFFGYIS